MKIEINRIKSLIIQNDNKKNYKEIEIGEKFDNLEEQTYNLIKNKILYHEIKPGERIIDANIAKELVVSRSLVRQVLNILVKEELLILMPRSGFYVRKITKKEVGEIYNIRKVLEAYATKLAVPLICDGDFKRLERLFKKAKKDLEKGKNNSFIETDIQLHKLFIDKCGNEHLRKIINQYNDRYIFYRVIDLSSMERAKKSYFEHYEIFKAAKIRDSKISSELMMMHIENSKKVIINNFDEYTFGDNKV